MKEFNSVLEVLHECRTQLIEAKARIKEREAEIDKYLSDYDKAIDAITPKVEVTAEQPQEQTERLPKVGDELVRIGTTNAGLKYGETYFVRSNTENTFEVLGVDLLIHSFTYKEWRKYFRFADEITPEDMSNLHSYLHAKGEAKKPYRIKTRQEMINGGGVEYDGFSIHKAPNDIPWVKDMDYLQGMWLKTNECQEIDGFTIEPWMITENN